MILTDTGPLIALLDKRDNHHRRCIDTVKTLPAEPMLTTWPCFTEAMHILGAVGGFRYQAVLWKLVEEMKLELHEPTLSETKTMHKLMKRYQDTPMDLADASLVALAEHGKMKRIFTVDSDFYIYRLSDGSMLEVIPHQ
ncbi:MAG: type II toxin-antitoxin system VapC family toxin [Candidatus Electrothrix sp. YB6]